MKELLIPIIVSALGSSGLWALISTLIAKRSANKSATNQALKSLLADRIQFLCKRALRDGEIEIEDYDNIINLYNPYVALGGNGTIKHLKEAVDDIKVKE